MPKKDRPVIDGLDNLANAPEADRSTLFRVTLMRGVGMGGDGTYSPRSAKAVGELLDSLLLLNGDQITIEVIKQ